MAEVTGWAEASREWPAGSGLLEEETEDMEEKVGVRSGCPQKRSGGPWASCRHVWDGAGVTVWRLKGGPADLGLRTMRWCLVEPLGGLQPQCTPPSITREGRWFDPE